MSQWGISQVKVGSDGLVNAVRIHRIVQVHDSNQAYGTDAGGAMFAHEIAALINRPDNVWVLEPQEPDLFRKTEGVYVVVGISGEEHLESRDARGMPTKTLMNLPKINE
jgi:hypothetical protein